MKKKTGIANSKKKKLNIGCGADVLPDYVNLDLEFGPGIDIAHDLNKFPYPFKDNTFDEIRAYSILEHVKDLMETMNELHRILKPNGTLDIIVPHYTSSIAWGNPTHVRPFAHESFYYFVKDSNGEQYTKRFFNEIDVKFRFGKKFQIWNWIIEPLANAFPAVYENTPMYMFPAMGLRIQLKK